MSAAAIGQAFLARFTFHFDQRRVWPNIVEDLSSEVQGQFDGVNIPRDDDDGEWTQSSLSNAQGGTLSNHAWPAATIPQATNQVLHLDQVYRINRLIPRVNITQLRPNQVESQAVFAARRAARLVNSYIRTRINALTGSTTLLPGISVSAGNFATPNSAFMSALRNAFHNAAEEMDYLDDGVGDRYAVVSPAIYQVLLRQREGAGINFAGPLNDQAAAMGVIMSLSGFNIIKDSSPGAGKTNSDDAKHTLYFMHTGSLSGVAFAVQLNRIVPWDGIQGGDHDGMYIRGTLVFGCVPHRSENIRLAKVSIT